MRPSARLLAVASAEPALTLQPAARLEHNLDHCTLGVLLALLNLAGPVHGC